MPLELHPILPADTLSWTRVRQLAYAGPTNTLLHNGPIGDSSLWRVAQDRTHELNKPHVWHWKIVDTDLLPSDCDPEGNGGRTIAIAVWSMRNITSESGEKPTIASAAAPVAEEQSNDSSDAGRYILPNFVPPELRLDAFMSLLFPIRQAQVEVMGSSTPYFMLNSLATHPDHQGRGAASMLLDWGMNKADEEGLVTYLDASERGRPIYEKRGFALIRMVDWDSRPWGGTWVESYGCMVREPKGNW